MGEHSLGKGSFLPRDVYSDAQTEQAARRNRPQKSHVRTASEPLLDDTNAAI
jgi:hypothetical protein